MREGVRWLAVLALALAVIGLAAYARGRNHHRGDDVGALRSVPTQSLEVSHG
jgi:hypothetical protein